MAVLLKIWSWLKGNALAVVSVIAAIAVSIVFWQRQRQKIGSLKDAVAIEKAKTKISANTAKKEIYKASAENTEVEEKALDAEILASKRTVVALKTKAEALSDTEVEDAFSRLYDRRL